MSAVRSHRDLRVWQSAMSLVDATYELAALLPKHETFGLASQMRRAAISIAANIAEGHGRGSRTDYLRHLSYAMGSAMELDTLFAVGLRRSYYAECQARRAFGVLHSTGKMLRRLIQALRTPNPPKPKTQNPTPSF